MINSTTIVPADVLPNAFSEPEGIHFWPKPFEVTKTVTDGIEEFTVEFSQPPMNGKTLTRFLKATAPADEYTSVSGIIADWNIVDRAESGAGAKNLVTLHERLNGPWQEFMKSRPALLDVLYDVSPPRFGVEEMLPYGLVAKRDLTSQNPLGTSSDIPNPHSRHYKEHALGFHARTLDTAVELLIENGVEDASEQLFQRLKESINLSRKMKLSNRQRIEGLIREGHYIRRNVLIRSVRKLLPPGVDEQIALDLFNREYAVHVTDEGKEYFYSRNEFDAEKFDEQLKAKKIVQKGPFEAEVAHIDKFDRQGERWQTTLVTPGSVKRIVPSVTVAPTLAWQRDGSGNRSFIFDRSVTEEEGTVYQDGILGPLVVAYLSPDIVATWPTEMTIGKSRPQELGAAQVPVLALFPKYQKQLLASEFIAVTEAAVA